jgi:hypothetical protein
MARVYLFYLLITLACGLFILGLYVLFNLSSPVIISILLEFLAFALLLLALSSYVSSIRRKQRETGNTFSSLPTLPNQSLPARASKTVLNAVGITIVIALAAWLIFLWSAVTFASTRRAPAITPTPIHKVTPTPKHLPTPTVTSAPGPTRTPSPQPTPSRTPTPTPTRH